MLMLLVTSCYRDAIEVNVDFPAATARRYQALVSVHWVKKLIDHSSSPQTVPRPATYDQNRFAVVHAGWGPTRDATRYLAGHVPGAIHVNTDDLETGYPEWKLLDAESLQAAIGRMGISPDTTVVVYGDKLIAAARVWWILKYSGVDDVRLMDGGIERWQVAGYATERQVRELPAVPFSASVLHHWLATTDEVRLAIDQNNAILADVRSDAEFVGSSSGYDYLEAKGRIPRAIHLGDADDRSGEYQRNDGCLRTPDEVLERWQTRGLQRDATGQRFPREVIFYCGGGWRSSVSFFVAWLAGIEPIRNYSDGWCGWSTIYQREPSAKGSTPGWRQIRSEHPIDVDPDA
jgi:thiosulfate/3-mercaptopyruvate sulfurtransferase